MVRALGVEPRLKDSKSKRLPHASYPDCWCQRTTQFTVLDILCNVERQQIQLLSLTYILSPGMTWVGIDGAARENRTLHRKGANLPRPPWYMMARYTGSSVWNQTIVYRLSVDCSITELQRNC